MDESRPTTPARNVMQDTTGKVHLGTWIKRFRTNTWIEAQACGTRPNQHSYGFPTDEAVTCKRCAAVKA